MQIAYNKSVLDGEEITVQAVCMLLTINSICHFAALLLFWGGLGFKTYAAVSRDANSTDGDSNPPIMVSLTKNLFSHH